MAAGRIQNRALLQRAADILRLEGLKQMPAHLNTEQVLMTFNLGSLATEAPELFSLQREAIGRTEIVGAAAYSLDISGVAAESVLAPLFPNANYDFWLVGLTLTVNYTTPGAVADNAKRISLFMNRYSHIGSLDGMEIIALRPWDIVAAGTLNYFFVLGGPYNWQGGTAATSIVRPDIANYYVPKGDRLTISLLLSAGTFAAGTTVDIKAHIFTKTPLAQTQWVPPS